MDKEKAKAAKGQLEFAHLALSMADDVNSSLQPLQIKGSRCVRLWMDIHLTEEKYQACQEMAFHQLLQQGLVM
jgi:hypothetical protein